MHGHSTFYCPKISPESFKVECETLHSKDLGTCEVLRIGPISIHADRRQLHQIHRAIGDCLALDRAPKPDKAAAPDNADAIKEAIERR